MKNISLLVLMLLNMFFLGCEKDIDTEDEIISEPTILGSAYDSDQNHNHITYINQTGSEKEFCIDVSFQPDIKKKIGAHSANYLNIPVHLRDKKHTIYFKKDGKEIKKNGKRFEVYRRDGENLYLWWDSDDKEYKVNDEPHIMADKGEEEYDTSKRAILFAHGYNDNQLAWDTYVDIAKDKGWRVFRTSVSEDGSIKKRASLLNKFIKKAAKQCNIKEGSLRVVGHSMGGLDLRYIVSKNWKGAKYIERVYTIATPHSGCILANLAFLGSDAARDLTPFHMKYFNIRYPYKDFKGPNDSPIGFLALRFACAVSPDEGDNDFMVEVSSQNYPNAPCSDVIYHGKHMPSAICWHGYKAELEQKDKIRMILKDHIEVDEDGDLFIIDNKVIHD